MGDGMMSLIERRLRLLKKCAQWCVAEIRGHFIRDLMSSTLLTIGLALGAPAALAVTVDQIGELEKSTAQHPAEFNIGDLIHVAMTWRNNHWGFDYCYFSVVAPGDGASYSFGDINGSCDRRDYPDGRVPKHGYQVIDTAKTLYAGELSLNLVPGKTYEAVTEIYPWRNTTPGVSSRYFKIRALSGGVSSVELDPTIQRRALISGAWRSNGATGTVKAWYKKDGVGPYILAGQGLDRFFVDNLPAGRQTLDFYVDFEGKYETYVGSKTIDVLTGSISAMLIEDKRLRVNGRVGGGVDQIKLETVGPQHIELGMCPVSDGEFSCLSDKTLNVGWHDIRITAIRDGAFIVLATREEVDVTPTACWADDNPTVRKQGQPFRLAVDKDEPATHVEAYWRRGNGVWHDSGEVELDSARSATLPGTAGWLPTDDSQYTVLFVVKHDNEIWSEVSEMRTFQVQPLPPAWPEPPAGVMQGRQISVKLTPPEGVDVVQPQWRRSGGTWANAESIVLPDAVTVRDHTIAIAESQTWSAGLYEIRLRVRKDGGLWSEPSAMRTVTISPPPAANPFAGSSLAVYRGEQALGANADVVAGESLTLRLRMQASHTVLGLQWSLALPVGLEKTGAPTYRADLSDQGPPHEIDALVQIGEATLNSGWSGAGGAFASGTHLLDPAKTLLGLVGGKRAVLDIPVRVKRDAHGTIQVITAGRANLVHRQEITSPPLRWVPDEATGGGPLRLKTLVDKARARPGETLAYTIEFMNRSDQRLHDLSIREFVPTHTTLISDSVVCKQMPSALACRVVASGESGEADDEGDNRLIQWRFKGELRPGQQGAVGFKVRVEP